MHRHQNTINWHLRLFEKLLTLELHSRLIQNRLPHLSGTEVILAFDSEQLRDCCESQVEAEREYGVTVAKNLRERLASLREADNIFEIPSGPPKVVAHSDVRCYEFDLGENYKLILSPNQRGNRAESDGQLNWEKVRRIRIHSIERRESTHE